MSTAPIETKRLNLVFQTPEDIRALIQGMEPSEKAELSLDGLALFHGASSADAWTLGFKLVHRATGVAIGNAGFKGLPKRTAWWK